MEVVSAPVTTAAPTTTTASKTSWQQAVPALAPPAPWWMTATSAPTTVQRDLTVVIPPSAIPPSSTAISAPVSTVGPSAPVSVPMSQKEEELTLNIFEKKKEAEQAETKAMMQSSKYEKKFSGFDYPIIIQEKKSFRERLTESQFPAEQYQTQFKAYQREILKPQDVTATSPALSRGYITEKGTFQTYAPIFAEKAKIAEIEKTATATMLFGSGFWGLPSLVGAATSYGAYGIVEEPARQFGEKFPSPYKELISYGVPMTASLGAGGLAATGVAKAGLRFGTVRVTINNVDVAKQTEIGQTVVSLNKKFGTAKVVTPVGKRKYAAAIRTVSITEPTPTQASKIKDPFERITSKGLMARYAGEYPLLTKAGREVFRPYTTRILGEISLKERLPLSGIIRQKAEVEKFAGTVGTKLEKQYELTVPSGQGIYRVGMQRGIAASVFGRETKKGLEVGAGRFGQVFKIAEKGRGYAGRIATKMGAIIKVPKLRKPVIAESKEMSFVKGIRVSKLPSEIKPVATGRTILKTGRMRTLHAKAAEQAINRNIKTALTDSAKKMMQQQFTRQSVLAATGIMLTTKIGKLKQVGRTLIGTTTRTMPTLESRSKEKLVPIMAPSTRALPTERTKVMPTQNDIQKIMGSSRTGFAETTVPKISTISSARIAVIPAVEMQRATRVGMAGALLTITPPPAMPKARGIPPPLILSFGGFFKKRVKEREDGQGYHVYILQGGKYFKATSKPTFKEDAIAFGAEVIDNTAQATFKIVRTKGKPEPLAAGFSLFGPEKFYEKKGRFTERNTYRIDTEGELEGITARGLLTQRRMKQAGIPMSKKERRRIFGTSRLPRLI